MLIRSKFISLVIIFKPSRTAFWVCKERAIPLNFYNLGSFYGCVTERTFDTSCLSFLENNFALLWYKTLHSEVAWTEENAGKSEFILFAAWCITLYKVPWCQNTIKIRMNKQTKQGHSFHFVCVPLEWEKAFFA